MPFDLDAAYNRPMRVYPSFDPCPSLEEETNGLPDFYQTKQAPPAALSGLFNNGIPVGFILDHSGNPEPVYDFIEWGLWMENNKHLCRVAEDFIPYKDGTLRVSTVFLGLDHNFERFSKVKLGGMPDYKPKVWETMGFFESSNPYDRDEVDQARCCGNFSDAQAMHLECLREYRADGTPPMFKEELINQVRPTGPFANRPWPFKAPTLKGSFYFDPDILTLNNAPHDSLIHACLSYPLDPMRQPNSLAGCPKVM